MGLYEELISYQPYNLQERQDKYVMVKYLEENEDCFSRESSIAHFSASVFVVDETCTKTLMVYHNIYDSWSWIGGHADGNKNLREVAIKELKEETGVENIKLLSENIYSIEVLPVSGHMKKGKYVSSHLHFNVTYLVMVDTSQPLRKKEDENKGVSWFFFEDALNASSEPWMVNTIYKKLIDKLRVKSWLIY